MKRAAVVAAVLVGALPIGGASADHCATSDIYLFTRYTVPGVNRPDNGAQAGNPSLQSGTVGCPTGTESPEGTPDTSLIQPGANSFSLRSVKLNAEDQYFTVTRATVTLSGAATDYAFTADDFTAGGASFPDLTGGWRFFRSDNTPNDSMGADFTATVEMCWLGAGCATRTYRTVLQPTP